MIHFKLIAFNLKEANILAPEALWAKSDKGEVITIEDLLSAGAPYTRFWLNRMINEKGVKPEEILAIFYPKPVTGPREIASETINGVTTPELIFIPKTEKPFKMGSNKCDDEKPIRDITLTRDFALGKHPITNEQWKAYLEDNGLNIPALAADPAKARHPVATVSWGDAVKYCKWLSKKTGKKYRLPTEAEWEYAARGPEGNAYPWGTRFATSKCNFNTKKTTQVDEYPEGKSWCGCFNMSGNVWEWVNDRYADQYDPNDIVDPKGPATGDSRVLRGGSWYNLVQVYLRGAYRLGNDPQGRDLNVGFRVAKDLS